MKLLKTDFATSGWGNAQYFVLEVDSENERASKVVASGSFQGNGFSQIVTHCVEPAKPHVVTVSHADLLEVGQAMDIGIEVCENTFIGEWVPE
jgi:type III secretion system FlhB-like substrate exporter